MKKLAEAQRGAPPPEDAEKNKKAQEKELLKNMAKIERYKRMGEVEV